MLISPCGALLTRGKERGKSHSGVAKSIRKLQTNAASHCQKLQQRERADELARRSSTAMALVEGESAAGAVAAVRQARTQAVLGWPGQAAQCPARQLGARGRLPTVPATGRRAQALGGPARPGLSQPGQPAARDAAHHLRRCRHAPGGRSHVGSDANGGSVWGHGLLMKQSCQPSSKLKELRRTPLARRTSSPLAPKVQVATPRLDPSLGHWTFVGRLSSVGAFPCCTVFRLPSSETWLRNRRWTGDQSAVRHCKRSAWCRRKQRSSSRPRPADRPEYAIPCLPRYRDHCAPGCPVHAPFSASDPRTQHARLRRDNGRACAVHNHAPGADPNKPAEALQSARWEAARKQCRSRQTFRPVQSVPIQEQFACRQSMLRAMGVQASNNEAPPDCGGATPRCRYAASVATRPRGVRCR